METQSSLFKIAVIVLAVIGALTVIGVLGAVVLHTSMMGGVSCQTMMRGFLGK